MITVGLIKELAFLSFALRSKVEASVQTDMSDVIKIELENNILTLRYRTRVIWTEPVEGDESFFGVESCDSIAKIIYFLNNNDPVSAEKLVFNYKSVNNLDKIPSSS